MLRISPHHISKSPRWCQSCICFIVLHGVWARSHVSSLPMAITMTMTITISMTMIMMAYLVPSFVPSVAVGLCICVYRRACCPFTCVVVADDDDVYDDNDHLDDDDYDGLSCAVFVPSYSSVAVGILLFPYSLSSHISSLRN